MKKSLVCLTLLLSAFIFSCKKEKVETNDIEQPNEITNATGTKFNVDTKESIINWTGFKLTGKHNGTIHLKEGFISLKDSIINGGRFFIDMNTITVTDLKAGDGKEDLENHLKGTGENEKKDHFFNVKKYPTSDFKITKVEKDGDKYIVFGNLSIKGITKAVNFPATIKVSDDEISINSEPLRLNRTYWNVNYASKSIFADIGDKFISDEIEVQVYVKAKK
ncbi:YceI family protein [Flavobacterium terrae]|uniref:YceI-like domain-containing protein n=1 Tax=Flavobacterium terrae TaxID=415425 RepID=A0A1M6D108_9FLAO|nr:YceI family protein [Flavobacterium terrae]SHI66995.1 YceI-like domain-containing protein [Flavobacterium terrae]